MSALWIVLGLIIFGLVLWAIGMARRLDRLHIRVDRARASLEAVRAEIEVSPAGSEKHELLSRRLALAIRFYNNAVADTRRLRLRPGVRAFRLAGTAPLPEFYS